MLLLAAAIEGACSGPTSSSSTTPITVSSTTITFPTTAVGQMATASVSVSTTSNATIGISSNDTANFPFSTTCTVSLPAGASCPVTVQFQPVVAGNLTAYLTINASTGKATVALSGTAVGGAAPTPGGGSSSPVTLLQILTAQPNPFYLAPAQTTQLQASALLAGGAAQDVTASATWSSSDPMVATVSASGLVTAVASGGASISVQYQGHITSIRVLVPGIVSITPSTFSFQATGVGQLSSSTTFTVTIGSGPNMISAITSSDPVVFPIMNTTCDQTGAAQAPGYTCTVQVAFNATSAGPHSAQLSVTSVEPPPGATSTATLTGAGQ